MTPGTFAHRGRFIHGEIGMTAEPHGKAAADEKRAPGKDAKRLAREKALDRALEDTFPASDPVAATEPAPGED
jgi:hypothetical protein